MQIAHPHTQFAHTSVTAFRTGLISVLGWMQAINNSTRKSMYILRFGFYLRKG
jgi:hypothetical protein